MIPENDLAKYISCGYVLGRLKFKSYTRHVPAHNKGKIAVTKDSIIKYIKKEDLQNYLQLG